MGNFYTNITVIDTPATRVVAAMRALNRESYVLESELDCVVFDRQSDDQDTEILSSLADHLSSKLEATTLAVLNHDDDVLWFQLFQKGDLISEYANRGGPPTMIGPMCQVFGVGEKRFQVWITLKRPFLFQVSRHLRLATLLGLPISSVASGFNYVERGELPPSATADRLHRVRPTG